MRHGHVTMYTTGGCRCEPCTKANTRVKKVWRMKTRADGDTPTIPLYVDAAPIREHVAALVKSGWTRAQIARELTTSQQNLYNLLDRERADRGGKRIRRDLAAQILALEPLEPIGVDPVIVERLLAGADWRGLATRAERIEAARRLTPGQWDRLGLNRKAMERAS